MKKIGFVTCVQLGLSCVEEIYRMGGTLDLLITLNDVQARDKSGRVYLDVFAGEHGIPLIKVSHINESAVRAEIERRGIDWLFIIGWSQIAGSELLNAPAKGCIGMHPTLLPKGRGRASIPWAILKGLKETGVTMFRLDEGVDTGDIIGQHVIPLNAEITATELYQRVNEAHVALLSKFWEPFLNDAIELRRQNEAEATLWPGRRPEDGELTQDMTVKEALTMIRAVTHPYPGAFLVKDGKKRIIWSAKESGASPVQTGKNLTGGYKIQLKDGTIEAVDYEVQRE